ncbi:hypothetical protein M413DRAFT_16921 [Hebeloma cylindrosporum]|uniref:Uncharacterized protein n=1 Tax=Hebeloma cylindrosporum TaxID=76867 RepID=A0A0C3CQR4_HEBCY|nr:hypothetical protein M413DRAFT_16921 [Hebeloma cylindrosporum h7]
MATPAAFSRLQLAAALLATSEYDNDLENPDIPYRSAQDSAIFAHLRRNPAARPELPSRRSDYLGVSLPSESGSLGCRESALDTRRSRASKGSMDLLRNPFGADNASEIEDNEGEEGLEVDLASWGLDTFMSKDKVKSAKAKGEKPPPAVGSTRSRIPSANRESSFTSPRRGLITAKSMSVGGRNEALEAVAPELERRRSFGSPLDLVGMEPSGFPLQRPRAVSHASFPPSHMVPFPTRSIRSPSPRIEQAYHDNKRDAYDQIHSAASMNVAITLDEEDNPFAIHHSSHISRFDPKSVSRARSHSNASMGSRLILDNEMDTASIRTGDPYARERRYSTLELLRPKVLVMPSPLQPVSSHGAPEPRRKFRDGFELSADGPPLPPGARSSRRLSSLSLLEAGGENIPLASNSFTPNPFVDLTLSQKTFRNTLSSHRPLTIHRVRVFTGDQRPSMMARDQQRSSTLIDPASLQTRPTNQRMSSYGSQNTQKGLARHPSVTIKPLLNFDGEDEKLLQPPLTANRLPNSRSVFGVDTLWQREMVKLKELQGAEERENAERQKRDEEAEKKKQEKKERKKKKKRDQNTTIVEDIDEPREPRVSAEPPILPNIRRASRRAPPKPSESDVSSESDPEDLRFQIQEMESNVWHSSDDEGTGPRRTTGTGPRYPNQAAKASPRSDIDSEEDLPLAVTIHKAAARAAFSNSQRPLDSDDEDRPLSQLLKATPATASRNLFVNPQSRLDDDDQPLGLRVSKANLYPSQEDEDDTPLALHPEQQRRTQYQLLAQQQQHQQQLMMQAQLQSSIMMNTSMMNLTPGYYPQPILNPMAMLQMQAPGPIPSPPPIHDEAKYGRVDRWRRDVVVDRESV